MAANARLAELGEAVEVSPAVISQVGGDEAPLSNTDEGNANTGAIPKQAYAMALLFNTPLNTTLASKQKVLTF